MYIYYCSRIPKVENAFDSIYVSSILVCIKIYTFALYTVYSSQQLIFRDACKLLLCKIKMLRNIRRQQSNTHAQLKTTFL